MDLRIIMRYEKYDVNIVIVNAGKSAHFCGISLYFWSRTDTARSFRTPEMQADRQNLNLVGKKKHNIKNDNYRRIYQISYWIFFTVYDVILLDLLVWGCVRRNSNLIFGYIWPRGNTTIMEGTSTSHLDIFCCQ